MDLLAYVKSNGLLPDNVLTKIIGNRTVTRRTFYQEMFLSQDKYGIKEDDLLKWIVSDSHGEIDIVSTTKGLVNCANEYEKMGGVQTCIESCIMFFKTKDSVLYVLTIRPDDNTLIAKLQKTFKDVDFKLAVCTKFVWNSLYNMAVEPLYIEYMAQKLFEKSAGEDPKSISAQKDSEARQVYNQIIQMGIERGASDAHLIPCDDGCNVNYRIDGINYQLLRIPNVIAARICNIIAIDGDAQRESDQSTLDGKIIYTPPGNNTVRPRDIRFSIMPTNKGDDLNIRYLNNRIYTFDQLGMSERNVKKYEKILNMPQGLIMQVGPTGSGKSTTLYAGLTYIMRRSLRNVIAAEDPVEIRMNGITQVDVNEKAGLTFARITRQFLRHDVDVGVIGEIRDEETAAEAIRAATTGHLIISSLHTNDSIGVFERMYRLNVDPYTLSEVLVAIMSQRLVRRLCPHCKQPYDVDPRDPIVSKYKLPTDRGPMRLYRAVGCEHCSNLGYSGRIAVNEILIVDRHLRNQISIRDTRMNIEEYLDSQHFYTMYMDAIDKVVAGLTSLEEITPMCEDTLAYK